MHTAHFGNGTRMTALTKVKSCESCANQLCYSPGRCDQGNIQGKIVTTVAAYYKHMRCICDAVAHMS